jgi:hypothetical protein
MVKKPKVKKRRSAGERRAKAALGICFGKLRYSVPESQVVIALGNTKFWAEVKRRRIQVHYDDAGRAFCTPQTLERYVGLWSANTTPTNRVKGVERSSRIAPATFPNANAPEVVSLGGAVFTRARDGLDRCRNVTRTPQPSQCSALRAKRRA